MSPIRLPIARSRTTDCGHRDPRSGRICWRAPGHSGRHAHYLRRSTGAVLGVWG